MGPSSKPMTWDLVDAYEEEKAAFILTKMYLQSNQLFITYNAQTLIEKYLKLDQVGGHRLALERIDGFELDVLLVEAREHPRHVELNRLSIVHLHFWRRRHPQPRRSRHHGEERLQLNKNEQIL